MANVDAPFGFRPVKQLDGSPYSGQTFTCAILAADGTATFIGDAVKLSGTADAEGNPSVVQAAATDAIIFGVVTSFDFDPTDLENKHRLASTLRVCQVAPALDALFEVQADGSNAITDVGATFDVVVGAGSTSTGLSAMELDSTTSGTGNTLTVLGLMKREDNEFASANPNLLVRFNESALRGAGTAA